ncbi:APC family permease [Pseudonocardia zijingensis]|uniref:Amino acid permease n=1 Tax=Pseudonocardia zijingensis TaxID=153376 RepID=A0ABN1N769_9PSEU
MGAVAGTFMALSAVLGSGMMILPGVSYHQLGRSAWLPWTIAAVSVIPLLCCYGWLGRRYPSASGVAHYAEVALGRTTGRAVGIIAAIGLLSIIPATATTGGRYIAQFSGVESATWSFPIIVLVGATAAAHIGANLSSRVQVGLITGLFVLVTCISVAALGVHGFVPPPADTLPEGDLGIVLTAVYVAFAGWETVAFTFEEHKRSDLIPRIFATSYVIVVALYAILLLGLLVAVDSTDPRLDSAPLLALAQRSLGSLAEPATLLVVTACIVANVFAATFALSRLIFGLARSGYLPAVLTRTRDADGNPVYAVLAVGSVLTPIAALSASGLFPLEVLFGVTGGLYFVLYGIGVAAFAVLAPGTGPKAVAAVGAATVVAVTVIGGQSMWLSWAAFLLALGVVALFGRRAPAVDPAEPATIEFPTVPLRVPAFAGVDQRTVELPRAPVRRPVPHPPHPPVRMAHPARTPVPARGFTAPPRQVHGVARRQPDRPPRAPWRG